MSDTSKITELISRSKYYETTNPDSAIVVLHQGYEIARANSYTKGEAVCLSRLGEMYMRKDNYFFGLQTAINALKLFETLSDEKGITETYYVMGNIYERLGDHEQALKLFYRCLPQLPKLKDSLLSMNCLGSIGFNYYKTEAVDSAFKYAQAAYDIARSLKTNNQRLPWAITLMGAVQEKQGNPAIAMAFYYDAIQKALAYQQTSLLPYAYQIMAELYKKTTMQDSAIAYGEKALAVSQELNFNKGIADASSFLANMYTGLDNNKAVAYYQLSNELHDSLFSMQKINQVQNITYNEALRQSELEKEKLRAAEERRQNIQYAGIIIGILAFLVLFLALSHTIFVNAKLVSFLGVMALLVVFEFINLIMHPFLAQLTHHSPAIMLGIMVVIAALLVPAHHYLQKWINIRLVAKNQNIRYKAARKIIEDYESLKKIT
jgi:tetratricopeptide (TPR) repeat protein